MRETPVNQLRQLAEDSSVDLGTSRSDVVDQARAATAATISVEMTDGVIQRSCALGSSDDCCEG